MTRKLSLFVFLAFVSSLLALDGNVLSFAIRPMLAGHASLTENGFVVSRTIGIANFSPEFRIPVQIMYESSSERRGIFGYGWRSPQLESKAYFAKDGVHWTTPWNQELHFPWRDGRVLPHTEWSASFSGDSPEKAEEWTFTGKNGKKGWSFHYAKARLVEIDAPSGRFQSWMYDEKGRLSAVSQNGRDFIVLSYKGALATCISVNGVDTSLEYKDLKVSILPKVASGKIADPVMPRLVKLSVDGLSPVEFQYGESCLAKIVQGECGEEFTVETETLEERQANLKSMDRKSGVKHTGKVAGRLLRDSAFEYAYTDATPGKIGVTDRKGQTTRFDFDRLKGVFSLTDAAGRRSQVFYYMRHDVAYLGRPRKVVDWKGRDVAAWQYDRSTAMPVSLVNSIGNETLLSYDADGNLARVERRADSDSDAVPFVSFSHGTRGELLELSSHDAAGKAAVTVRMAYDGQLQPVEVSDGRGTFRFSYNDFGYVERITDAAGAVRQSVAYDSYNRPVAVTDANRVATRLYRLDSGLVRRAEKVLDGEIISSLDIEYDACGRPWSYSDHRGRRRAFERDEFGRVAREFLPDGSSIAYSFDAAGKLSKVIDQNQHEIAFGWSAFGLDSRTTAVGQVTDYVHDKFGLLKSVSSIQDGRTDRRITYEYDKFDRPVKITYGPGEVETISYDAWGRVASRVRDDRKAEYRYDHWGRLVEKVEAGVKTTYAYNAYGQRLSLTVKDGTGVSTETRRYDELGRLAEIAENGKSVQFQYDAQGRVVGQSLNGLPVTLTYTQLGQLDTKTWGDAASPLATLKYFYDSDGSLVGREVSGRRQSYVQDSRGQLLAVKDADGKVMEEYRYDPAGNILSKTVNGRTTVFTYDAANQLVSSECDGKTAQYAYDAAGRMVRDGVRTYRYGWLDKVTSITENGNPYAAYNYHVDGQLASAKYADRQETFLWDGLALVRRNNNAFINEPHPGGGAPVVSSNDGTMLNDMLGTTIGMVNGANARMTGVTAFGETSDNTALFTGKPMVDGLGYAFLFRNYRPQNGKWLTADPIGYPDGWNNLAYCTNCPCMLVDTNGGFISFGFAAIGAALSSAGYVASSLLTGNEITTSGLIGAAAGGFTAGAIMGVFTTLDPSAGVVATGIMGAISAAGGKVVNNIVSNFSFQEVTDGVATAAIIGGIGAGIGSALNWEGLMNHAASFATGVVTDIVDYVYNTIYDALFFLDETQQNRFNDVLGMISQFIVPSLMADDVVFDYSLHMLE